MKTYLQNFSSKLGLQNEEKLSLGTAVVVRTAMLMDQACL